MTSHAAIRAKSTRPWPRLGLAVIWLALGIYFVMPVTRVLEPDLDSSIHASYAYLTAHGFQFGPQVNTTVGPYGFVMFGWDYGGELFWTRLGLILFFALVLAALTIWFFRATRGSAWRWAWLAAMLLELSVGDTLFATAVLLSGLFLLVTYAQPAQRWTSAGVAGFLAYLSLMKGTQLAESLGVLACVLLLAARARNWRRARWILGSFVTSLICWWLAAGQNPLHLPSYFNGLRHIAQGYNEAMALETPGGLLAVGLALLTGLSGLYAWTAWRHRAHPAMLAACALLAGMTFVSWKHGYLRSDNHMLFSWTSPASWRLRSLGCNAC